jgi:hypothetical protein
LSDGSFIDQGATLTSGEQKRLYRLERKAARQRAGTPRGGKPSRRLLRTYTQIAGVKARQARRRYDFAHQVTAALVATGVATLVVEDLRVKNMTRSASGTVEEPGVNVKQKSGLNRSILNQGWTQILRLLTEPDMVDQFAAWGDAMGASAGATRIPASAAGSSSPRVSRRPPPSMTTSAINSNCAAAHRMTAPTSSPRWCARTTHTTT